METMARADHMEITAGPPVLRSDRHRIVSIRQASRRTAAFDDCRTLSSLASKHPAERNPLTKSPIAVARPENGRRLGNNFKTLSLFDLNYEQL